MSGHSKWAQIKRKKALTDSKKGQIFSKLSKIIELTAKKGIDPKTNFSLKTAIDQAKAVNMPASNIDRAIEKGGGKGEVSNLEKIIYEAYGPGGVALMIVAVTNNKNRTVSDIKHILSANDCNMTGTGSAKWLFEMKPEDGKAVLIPKQTIKLNEVDESKLSKLLSELDEQDDVSEVFSNAD